MSSILNNAIYADFSLLAVILLGTSFLFNKGHFFPQKNRLEHIFYEKVQKQDAPDSRTQVTRDLGEVSRKHDANFVVLWGSQSGTAEGLAQRLTRDVQQHFGCQVVLGDLSNFDPDTIANIPGHVFLVLVLSTYGEGDPSDNAQDFISYLTSASSAKARIEHLRFAAFGCGNSSYRHYNKVVYDAASALEKCGAKAIVPVGVGDEAKRTTYEDFHQWKKDLFSCLVSEHNMVEHDVGYQPAVNIQFESSPAKAPETMATTTAPPNAKVVSLPIVSNQTLTLENAPRRSCVHVVADLSGHPEIKYRTGDHIAIWPRNPKQEVDLLLHVMQRESQRHDCLRITPIDAATKTRLPVTTTLEDLVSRYLDIGAQVPRETIMMLAKMVEDVVIRQELQRISGTKESYSAFVNSSHLTLGRLLAHVHELHSTTSWEWLPISFLVDLIPPLKPRLYSIASSSIVEPKQVSLVVSVKPEPLPDRPDTLIHGLASTYLANLSPSKPSAPAESGDLVQAEIRRSTFKLPFSPQTPIIMIAAGTGIAPFRAFVHERARLAAIGRAVGPMLLFFGCRSESDALFVQELAKLATSTPSGLDLQIHTAFSRESGQDKVYVQDRVREHRDNVTKYLLQEDAGLYICGATAMAKEVTRVVLDAVMDTESWTDAQADEWRQTKRRTKRWSEDVWG